MKELIFLQFNESKIHPGDRASELQKLTGEITYFKQENPNSDIEFFIVNDNITVLRNQYKKPLRNFAIGKSRFIQAGIIK